jgi:hypothetical protein
MRARGPGLPDLPVHLTIMGNCLLGLCQNPIDLYIIWKLGTWRSHKYMLTFQLNIVLKYLERAAVECSPFPEHYLLKNYHFFQKISFLIVRNVIFNGQKMKQPFSQSRQRQMNVLQTAALLSRFVPLIKNVTCQFTSAWFHLANAILLVHIWQDLTETDGTATQCLK